MSVIVTGMDMPKSCAECQDQRCKASDEWDSFDWCDYKRVEGCQLKSISGLIEKIKQAKQYKGKNENSYIDAHDVGLDRYFDLGLDKAIKIIKEYCEVKG